MPGKRIRDVVEQLAEGEKLSDFLAWPPNAFALTSVLLGESGAYRQVVDPPEGITWPPSAPDKWADEIAKRGNMWRSWSERALAGSRPAPPKAIATRLDTLNHHLDNVVHDVADRSHWPFCANILELHAMADAACYGVGIPGMLAAEQVLFYATAAARLRRTGSLSTVSTSRIRVLPKLRTPQVGISLRSLSHHLAVDRSEVNVDWYWQVNACARETRTLNLLILPWPLKVEPRDFKIVSGPLENMDASKFGFFEFSPKTEFDVAWAKAAIDKAREKVGGIDGIVLPEAALREVEVRQLESIVVERQVGFFVAGVRGRRENYAHLAFRKGNSFPSVRTSTIGGRSTTLRYTHITLGRHSTPNGATGNRLVCRDDR